jgi:excisionase family DNA binding protein
MDRLLTPDEVAKVLGVSVRYVWRMGRTGRLPRIKPPGTRYVRFRQSDVEHYIESGRRS